MCYWIQDNWFAIKAAAAGATFGLVAGASISAPACILFIKDSSDCISKITEVFHSTINSGSVLESGTHACLTFYTEASVVGLGAAAVVSLSSLIGAGGCWIAANAYLRYKNNLRTYRALNS